MYHSRRHKATPTNRIQFSEFIHLASTFGSYFHAIINIGFWALYHYSLYYLFSTFFSLFFCGTSLPAPFERIKPFGLDMIGIFEIRFQSEYAWLGFYWMKSTISTSLWLHAQCTVCQLKTRLETKSEYFVKYIKAMFDGEREKEKEIESSKQ